MGCGPSAHDTRLETVDDSVHVMLKHDKKRQQQKGEAPKGYVPRAEHPLLRPKAVDANEEKDNGGGGGGSGGANTATTTAGD